MEIIHLEKGDLRRLDVQKGDDLLVWNLSVEHPIDVISGPNGFTNIALASRSGIMLRQIDSSMQVRSLNGAADVGYQVNFDPAPAPSNPLKGKSFYVDPGHGGTDPGAVNTILGYEEKVAALDIGLLLRKELEGKGATVYMTRVDDRYPTLTWRTDQANAAKVDAFISIHLNSAADKTANGVETLVYKANSGVSGQLANVVQENLVAATGFRNRGVKSRPDLHVLKATKMPAILCEIGFISNDEEANFLFSALFQKEVATAIANGIIKVFGV